MKRIINCILLLFSILGFAACSASPEAITPTMSGRTPTALHLLRATATLFDSITPTMTIQPTQLPSPTPSLWSTLQSGLYVVFKRPGKAQDWSMSLSVLSIDGKEYGTLLDDKFEDVSLSPDGKMIAYPIYVADPNNPSPPYYVLRLMDIETNTTHDFTISDCLMYYKIPTWSPDGTQLAYPCENHISIIAIAGENVTSISSILPANVKKENEIDRIAWSPDGKYLSFYILKPFMSGPSDPFSIEASPYLISSECPDNASTCKVAPTSLGVKGTSISRWTPDNLLAVFHMSGTYSDVDGIVDYNDSRFNLFDPITKKIVRSIVMPVDLPISSFAWSPDNKWIVYATYSDGNGPTYIMPASGGESKVLTENGGDIMFWLQVK